MVIQTQSVPPQPWRNGGGFTRELLTWPKGSEWRVRISCADIEVDGPFSVFPDIERWCAVIAGEGVSLKFADRTHILEHGDAPFCFDGGAAPMCHLMDGPVRDLNLMIRRGSGVMVAVNPQQSWQGSFVARGIYTLTAGTWRNQTQTCALPANSLMWLDDGDASEWTFAPDNATASLRAWWLGYREGHVNG